MRPSGSLSSDWWPRGVRQTDAACRERKKAFTLSFTPTPRTKISRSVHWFNPPTTQTHTHSLSHGSVRGKLWVLIDFTSHDFLRPWLSLWSKLKMKPKYQISMFQRASLLKLKTSNNLHLKWPSPCKHAIELTYFDNYRNVWFAPRFIKLRTAKTSERLALDTYTCIHLRRPIILAPYSTGTACCWILTWNHFGIVHFTQSRSVLGRTCSVGFKHEEEGKKHQNDNYS